MTELPKERRDRMREHLDIDPFDDPLQDNDELLVLLDMADERDRLRGMLTEIRDEYFAQRADADCEGDPLRHVPNEEMQWQVRIDEAMNGSK